MPRRSSKPDSLRVAQLHLSYFKAIPGGQRGERHREPPTASLFLKSTAAFSEVTLFSTSSSKNKISCRMKPFSFLVVFGVFFPLFLMPGWLPRRAGAGPVSKLLHQGSRSSAG